MAGETAREFYDKALKRHEELTLELEALRGFIDAYEHFQKKFAVAEEATDEQPDLYKPASSRAAKAIRIADTMAATRRIILREGRPMKRGELVRRLIEQGFEIEGTDKNKVFGTNLWRSGKFRPVGNRGYWPLDIEIPGESRNDQD